MKKSIIVLLVAAQILSLASCASDPQETESDAVPANPSETEIAETDYYDTLEIPDFQDGTFTMLVRTDLKDEMYAEMMTAEVVNDAVYTRNTTVADKLGIKLEVVDQPGDWANKDLFVQHVRSVISSGDDAYQVIAGYMNYMPPTIQENLYLDINTLPYIELDNPWWTDGFNNNVTINDKMYMAMGDMCSTMLRFAYCGYANNTILENNGYDVKELYQTVRDGKWTFDLLLSMSETITNDIDGDSDIDANDLHGIGMHNMPVRALINAFAIDFTTRDEAGLPVLALYGDKLVSAYDKVKNAVNSVYWYGTNDSGKFKENRTLFYFDVLGATSGLRDMESGFAVVPMPKYDEAQDSYRTETVDTTSILLVPTTVQNTELTGITLECLNYESYRLVTPAYFETAMQSKYSRDLESQEMMEIVRDSIYFDFGYVFAGNIGGNNLMEYAMNGDDITSIWKSQEKMMERNMKRLLKFFDEE